MPPLPPIGDKIARRPGNYSGTQARMIPDGKHEDFWRKFYKEISSKKLIYRPVKNFRVNRVNPLFGYFGHRFHPSKHEPYFHIGIDISGITKNAVYPVADGILEYSGFGVINGNYVLLRHDDIKTEDGYRLFSMYAHLKRYSVGFTNYQKMLREISLRTYPEIPIPKSKLIGMIGDSGNPEKGNLHLHLQLEFRKDKQIPIVIDPLRALGHNEKENITSKINKMKEFEGLYNKYFDSLKKYGLLGYWQNKD